MKHRLGAIKKHWSCELHAAHLNPQPLIKLRRAPRLRFSELLTVHRYLFLVGAIAIFNMQKITGPVNYMQVKDKWSSFFFRIASKRFFVGQ